MPPKRLTAPKDDDDEVHDLVTVGARQELSTTIVENRLQRPQKPTTARALVLRQSKHGAFGTGEIILTSKMTGFEKLNLLAEDYARRSAQAVARPFRLEEALKIAESQADVYLDEIRSLHDPDLFFEIISAEIESLHKGKTHADLRPTEVAKVIMTKIHNFYMLASGWKLVSESLNSLANSGMTNANVKTLLATDLAARDTYLFAYDMVKMLGEVGQNRVALLATRSPHYEKYFRLKTATDGTLVTGRDEYTFDWKDLRNAARSFLDSIIIELCFPGSRYSKAVLYQILHDAVTEAKREVNRFPQALWDAIGDLSCCVELQDILEAPLAGKLSPLKTYKGLKGDEYEDWVDAQIISQNASDITDNLREQLYPFEKTRKKENLSTLWKNINLNYSKVAQETTTVEKLWDLESALKPTPTWHTYNIPLPKTTAAINARLKRERELQGPRGRAAIANASDSDDAGYDSMPDLQSLSGTSEGEWGESSESDDDDGQEGYETEPDSDVDEAFEDELWELCKEAKQAARDAAAADGPASVDPLQQVDDKNPFLKLLGSLRGRLFNASPKIKVPVPRTEPRPAAVRAKYRATATGIKEIPTTKPPKPTPATSASKPSTPSKPPRATVEDADSEDEGEGEVPAPGPKKKKKKKPKKKKKSVSEPAGNGTPSEVPTSPTVPSTTTTTTPQAPTSPPPPKTPAPRPSTPQKETKKPTAPTTTSPKAAKATPLVSKPPPPGGGGISLGGTTANASTASLLSGTQFSTKPQAQSSHSYLKNVNSAFKQKVKSRPDHSSLFSKEAEDAKKGGGDTTAGLFAKVASSIVKKPETQEEMKKARVSVFAGLGKKVATMVYDMFVPGPDRLKTMKWDNFVKVMTDMGFTCDETTAGSSVRFDPPSKDDKPITIHRPHPGNTFKPGKFRQITTRLQTHYGWSANDLAKLKDDD